MLTLGPRLSCASCVTIDAISGWGGRIFKAPFPPRTNVKLQTGTQRRSNSRRIKEGTTEGRSQPWRREIDEIFMLLAPFGSIRGFEDSMVHHRDHARCQGNVLRPLPDIIPGADWV